MHISVNNFLFFDSKLVYVFKILDLLNIHLYLGEIHVGLLVFFEV